MSGGFFFVRIRRPPRSTRTDTLFPCTTLFRSKSFSQELRLSGDMGRFLWMIGGSYQRQTANEYQHLSNPGSQGSFDFSGLEPILGPDVGRIYYWNYSDYLNNRSEERRVGKECVRACRYRGSQEH